MQSFNHLKRGFTLHFVQLAHFWHLGKKKHDPKGPCLKIITFCFKKKLKPQEPLQSLEFWKGCVPWI